MIKQKIICAAPNHFSFSENNVVYYFLHILENSEQFNHIVCTEKESSQIEFRRLVHVAPNVTVPHLNTFTRPMMPMPMCVSTQ